MTLAKSFSVGSPYPRLTVLLLRRCKPTCAGPVNLLRRNMNTNTSRETGARLVRAAMKQPTRDRACRLLHEALCDDLELGRLTVHVERDRVSLTSIRSVADRKAKWSLAKIPRPRMSVC
jgi:hypothetical protein